MVLKIIVVGVFRTGGLPRSIRTIIAVSSIVCYDTCRKEDDHMHYYLMNKNAVIAKFQITEGLLGESLSDIEKTGDNQLPMDSARSANG